MGSTSSLGGTGGGLMGGGGFSQSGLASIAGKFGTPGVPGAAGGTPMPMGTAFSGSTGAGSGIDMEMIKKLGEMAGGGMDGGSGRGPTGGPQSPGLMRGVMGPFQPMQFSVNNYRFRRGPGY